MTELLSGLLGALVCFTGFYVWWTLRRFRALKAVLTEVLERCGPLEHEQEANSRQGTRHDGRLHELEHRVTVLVNWTAAAMDRQIPASPDRPDRLMATKAPKTAWQHLSEKLDGI